MTKSMVSDDEAVYQAFEGKVAIHRAATAAECKAACEGRAK